MKSIPISIIVGCVCAISALANPSFLKVVDNGEVSLDVIKTAQLVALLEVDDAGKCTLTELIKGERDEFQKEAKIIDGLAPLHGKKKKYLYIACKAIELQGKPFSVTRLVDIHGDRVIVDGKPVVWRDLFPKPKQRE